MTSSDEQIVKLNTRCKLRIAPSKVHGVGIFAITDIHKGERLYAGVFPEPYTIPYSSFGKLFPEVRQIIIERWPLVASGKSHFFYPDANMPAYMNHADDPNYDNKTDCALRDIKAGEEVFETYRNIEGAETIFPFLAVDKPKRKKRVV